jgi:hypothetical protein
MKITRLLLFFCIFLLCACNKINPSENEINQICVYNLGEAACKNEINMNDVIFDEKTETYNFKTGGAVTGKVVTYDDLKRRIRIAVIKDAKRIDKHYAYFPEMMTPFYEYAPIEDNKVTGLATGFYLNGDVYRTVNYKDNKISGTIYYSDGRTADDFEYDNIEESSRKSLEAIDRLELTKFETGFYRDECAVVMYFKNSSAQPLAESVKIKAVFKDKGGKELGSAYEYFQLTHAAPLSSGQVRRIALTSGVLPKGTSKSEVFCYIYINGVLFKKDDVDDKVLDLSLT